VVVPDGLDADPGIVDDALADPQVAGADQPAHADRGRAVRVRVLHGPQPVAVHALPGLWELDDVVLVAGLVLQRRVHRLQQPVHELAHLVLLHPAPPPWSLTGADATMGRPADVALRIACGKAEMEFGILGPLEVRNGSAVVRVPGAKERALLADLVVNAGRVVSADRLVEDLWGEHPPGNPADTLQGRVSALRRALGPSGAGMLVTRPPGYVLEAGPGQVDAYRSAQAAGRELAAEEALRLALGWGLA
jgi:DNA-binding winged helix-turn-helix (wHTH) protein